VLPFVTMDASPQLGLRRLGRCVVVLLLVLWAMNTVAFCAIATGAAADQMACCHPSDCDQMASIAPVHNCCAIQSNPTHAAVIPVLLTDHVAGQDAAVMVAAATLSYQIRASATATVSPHAPPGCHSILRI
jgi:hypothetical protein